MNNPVADDSAAKALLVDQFIEIAGPTVDRQRAQFYLDSANGDLSVALSSFYEADPVDDLIADENPDVAFADINDEDVQIIEPPRSLDDDDSSSVEIDVSSSNAAAPKRPTTEMSKKKFGTLFSSKDTADSGNSDEDGGGTSNDKGQSFYVGGSEHSGQQVLGPPRKREDRPDIAERVFQQARQHGAEQIDISQRAGHGSKKPSAFAGSGHRLGEASEPFAAASTAAAATAPSMDEPTTVAVVMRMWQNGFTLDDGPLRRFDDPTNEQFLKLIMEGRLPPELTQAHRGKRVDLEMEDHRHEEYKPPKVASKPFTGHGYTLGSPVPEVTGAGKVGVKSDVAAAAAASPASPAANASAPFALDNSKPITTIQVRLANGERLVIKLNHDHTVNDLRRYIISQHPEFSDRAFVLMTSFPSAELANGDSTLAAANLLNAVVLQRFK